MDMFYSHVICLGTKIVCSNTRYRKMFYSHVICLGTKIDFQFVIPFMSFTVT